MSQLSDLQSICINRLSSVEAGVTPAAPVPANNATIQWIGKRIGDISNLVDLKTGVLKVGILGIILTPGAVLTQRSEGPAIPLHAKIEVQIQENVLINHGPRGTGIDALDLVEFVMKRLHWFSITGQRSNIKRIELDEEPYALIQDIPTLIYNVNFRIPLTIS